MRSLWKIPYYNHHYLKIYYWKNKNKYKIFEIKTKNSIISHHFIDKTVTIHNGRYWFEFTISPNMIGHKFGEFVSYKTFLEFKHVKNEKKKNKKK